MPKLSVWFIRASLLYLGIGFTFGALLLFNKGIPLQPLIWRLLPAHIEFLLIGWVIQLVFGTAFWILPRFSRGSRRGNEKLAWSAFILLNLGILLVGAAPFFPPAVNSAPLILIGRACEIAAAAAFAAHAWPRIKSASK